MPIQKQNENGKSNIQDKIHQRYKIYAELTMKSLIILPKDFTKVNSKFVSVGFSI